MAKQKTTELVPFREAGTELALPDDLISKAKGYVVNARALRTRQEYARCWRDFVRWCVRSGREPLPAGMDTIIAYLSWMAAGRDNGKTPALDTMGQARAAIILAQRSAGYSFDAGNQMLKEVMTGIRRAIAKERTIRRVKPLLQEDLRDILDGLRPDVLREARDAALLSLGWAGALRRSELVGLDWGELGKDSDGCGFVTTDDKGLVITLMTSKSSQDTAVTIAIPRTFAPQICTAVEDWVKFAPIPRGSPMFRAITGRVGGKTLASARLDSRTVADIVKRRVHVLARAKGRKKLTKAEAQALMEQFSGHSMRVGFVTSAAERDVPTHRIREQTRHKSDSMVSIYIREVDKFKNSGLKGVGF